MASRLPRRISQENIAPQLANLEERDAVFSFKSFEDHLVDILCDNGKVPLSRVMACLSRVGLYLSDPRLTETMKKIKGVNNTKSDFGNSNWQMDKEVFIECIKENIVLLRRAFTGDFVIPDFKSFCDVLGKIFVKCKENKEGKPATYIPQLARYDPENWGVVVCSVDGQRHALGDTQIPFTIQSCSKPLNYALALSALGPDFVHKYIGEEPSGESFNHIKLGHGNKPHNPMINTGAIVTASLLNRGDSLADRFDYENPEQREKRCKERLKRAINQYRKLAGNEYVGFNNAVFLSERETADRNYALGYYLRENKCFPEGTNLHETMDFYFQLCSVEVNCESASVIAATLANGGYCPITGEKVLEASSVRNTLSLMHSCGMYDYSGQFAFKVGLPAKSGVSGLILLVVPNVCGMALWSPSLDTHGNSVRGIQFCQELVNTFNFHHYDNLKYTAKKLDPRVRQSEAQSQHVVSLLFGAYKGDLTALRRMALVGNDMSVTDYDGRTAIHLAASEGHIESVKFLVEKCHVPVNPRDRWGRTPLDDAIDFNQSDVAAYLKQNGGEATLSKKDDEQ